MKPRKVYQKAPSPKKKKTGMVKGKDSSASKSEGGPVAAFPRPNDQGEADAVAEFVLKPSTSAAMTLKPFFQVYPGSDLSSLLVGLEKSIGQVQAGDMKECEAMLMGQAHALQAVFMNLSRQAMQSKLLVQFEAYLRIALRAQNQCRATLETLGALKNPQVVFARQANIANGPQQVNNGTPSPILAPAHEAEPHQNELMEAQLVERMDPRTEGKTGGSHSKVEAVGTVNRPKKR